MLKKISVSLNQSTAIKTNFIFLFLIWMWYLLGTKKLVIREHPSLYSNQIASLFESNLNIANGTSLQTSSAFHRSGTHKYKYWYILYNEVGYYLIWKVSCLFDAKNFKWLIIKPDRKDTTFSKQEIEIISKYGKAEIFTVNALI